MKKTWIGILSLVGFVLGAAFATLIVTDHYGVLDLSGMLESADYLIYLVIAAAAIFAICMIVSISLAFSIGDKKRRSEPTILPNPSTTLPSESENSPEERPNDPLGDFLEPDIETSEEANNAVFSDLLQSLKEGPQTPMPTAPPERQAAPVAPFDPDIEREWQTAAQILDEEIGIEDIVFTGSRPDDALDLDEEFLTSSKDETVTPRKLKSTRPAAPRAQESSEPAITARTPASEPATDQDRIVQKINAIIDIVSELDGKKK